MQRGGSETADWEWLEPKCEQNHSKSYTKKGKALASWSYQTSFQEWGSAWALRLEKLEKTRGHEKWQQRIRLHLSKSHWRIAWNFQHAAVAKHQSSGLLLISTKMLQVFWFQCLWCWFIYFQLSWAIGCMHVSNIVMYDELKSEKVIAWFQDLRLLRCLLVATNWKINRKPKKIISGIHVGGINDDVTRLSSIAILSSKHHLCILSPPLVSNISTEAWGSVWPEKTSNINVYLFTRLQKFWNGNKAKQVYLN